LPVGRGTCTSSEVVGCDGVTMRAPAPSCPNQQGRFTHNGHEATTGRGCLRRPLQELLAHPAPRAADSRKPAKRHNEPQRHDQIAHKLSKAGCCSSINAAPGPRYVLLSCVVSETRGDRSGAAVVLRSVSPRLVPGAVCVGGRGRGPVGSALRCPGQGGGPVGSHQASRGGGSGRPLRQVCLGGRGRGPVGSVPGCLGQGGGPFRPHLASPGRFPRAR
jgi:hypothetical protein